MAYIDQIDKTRVPKHIAIIMDGNGRWAKARGEKRTMGHIAGVETVRRITKTAKNAGVKFLTLYTFSTENWNRPAEEIEALMGLLLKNLEDEIFMKNDVSFQVIGDLKRLPEAIQKKIQAQQELEVAKINKQTASVEAEKEKEVALIKAEQDKETAQINAEKAKIKAEGEAEATRIAAEAEAEANRKVAGSLTPELIESKKIEKWNGTVPQIQGGATPIVDMRGDNNE